MMPGAFTSILRVSVGRRDRPLAVDRHAERVDHAADERVADGHLRDLAGALDGVALAHLLEVAEQRDADVVLFQVQHQPDDAAVAEVEQLAGHRRLEAVDAGDAVAGLEHGAGLHDGDLLVEALDLLADDLADLFGANLHDWFSLVLAFRLVEKLLPQVRELGADAAVQHQIADLRDHAADELGSTAVSTITFLPVRRSSDRRTRSSAGGRQRLGRGHLARTRPVCASARSR